MRNSQANNLFGRYAANVDILGDFLGLKKNAAGFGAQQTGNCAQQGRFSGTVRSNQGHDFSMINLQAHSLQYIGFSSIDVDIPNP
jgi:hypothetical protein